MGVPEVFPAVEPESPFHPRLGALRDLLAADPRLLPGDGDSVRAELLPRRRSTGEVQLRRFFWSVRRAAPQAPLGLTARTLYVDGKTGDRRTFDFPDEPVMHWLAADDGPLYSHGRDAGVHVLRYIPLRRVTFLLRDAPGLPPRVIAKTKRESGLRRAASALTAAHEAAQESRPPFAVPRPVRLDLARRLLYLEEVPGRPLDLELESLGIDRAMRDLGRLHRELHELPVAGLRSREVRDWLDDVADGQTAVALLLPSVADRLERLLDRLRRTAPTDDGLSFAQGDFVPSQILWHPDGWSVIDLDDGHYADPHAEVAALYTALAWELPASTHRAQEARETYLDAYQSHAGRRLDPARWRWFLDVAELRYLARRTVKGRSLPGEAQQVLDRIEARSMSPLR